MAQGSDASDPPGDETLARSQPRLWDESPDSGDQAGESLGRLANSLLGSGLSLKVFVEGVPGGDPEGGGVIVPPRSSAPSMASARIAQRTCVRAVVSGPPSASSRSSGSSSAVTGSSQTSR